MLRPDDRLALDRLEQHLDALLELGVPPPRHLSRSSSTMMSGVTPSFLHRPAAVGRVDR